MANRRKDSTLLMNQVISKLLDSQSVKVPKDSALLQLLHPTAQKPPNYADTPAKTAGQATRQGAKCQRKNIPLVKKATKTTGGKVLVLVAWILLVLNVLVVLGSLGYGLELPLSLHAIENTNGCLFQMGMLAFGAFVLAWTTWLYLRNRAGETVAVPLLIVIALAVPLASLIKESGNGITDIRGLGQTLLWSFPATTTPIYRLVTGIIYSEDKPSAVIGNRVVREGDTLRSINVVKIYKDKVEFEKNGKRWTQAVEEKPTTY